MRCIVLIAVLIIALPATLRAADFPALTDRVVDNANLIDPGTEATLIQKLAEHEARSSDQLVVATIPSLKGEPLERYANELFRHWGLGQDDENNGVLLLVARDDRKVRIEVGYGLEGTLTDLHSKLIIENILVPSFRQGDFPGGISSATDEIIGVLSGNAAELEARYLRNNKDEWRSTDFEWLPFVFIILWFSFFFGSLIFIFLAVEYGRKIGPGQYKWLGVTVDTRSSGRSSGSSSSSWSSSSSGGFSGGGGSSGGGGASGSW